MRSFFHLLITCILLSGCVASSITPTGSEPRQPASDPNSIVIFHQEGDVGKAFKTLGIINYKNPGKYQILTLEKAIPQLKEQASTVGANGIIIDRQYPIRSGVISTGIGVEARAIRF